MAALTAALGPGGCLRELTLAVPLPAAAWRALGAALAGCRTLVRLSLAGSHLGDSAFMVCALPTLKLVVTS